MEEPVAPRPLRLAALVKQIPAFESMSVDPVGRLVRDGVPLEMSAHCRRAVAQAVAFAAERDHSTVCVITLGPPAAEDVLREAIAYGHDCGVGIEGVHVTDAAFAGSDTLATARALEAAIRLLEAERGPFDLVLCGRSSVDAGTGQVGPELAELLDLPFATGVKRISLDPDGRFASVGCELDDVWQEATLALPAIISTAERLIDPCKVKDPVAWEGIDASRLRRLGPADLGPGPWGSSASPTSVGETRVEVVERAGVTFDGPIPGQVEKALAFLVARGAMAGGSRRGPVGAVPATGGSRAVIVVVCQSDRARLTRELLGSAAVLASGLGGRVVAVFPEPADPGVLASWGADEVVSISGSDVEEDVARAVRDLAAVALPWAVLVGGTPWGREVASRAAAALDAGLTGDAVGLALDDGRLVAWKPAFGGGLVAGIRCSSPVQLATVRAGVLPLLEPRSVQGVPPVTTLTATPRGRVTVHARTREDDVGRLAGADVVVGVGQGVDPTRYGELDGLLSVLGGELAATRKVTDRGWQPHARQVGVTGLSIAPRLYVAIGTSGKYNHMVGVRSAGTILAVNPDPDAAVFGFADVGIVAAWHDAVPELERRLRAAQAACGAQDDTSTEK